MINEFFLNVILFIVFSSPPPSCLKESKKKFFNIFFSLQNVDKDQWRQMCMDIKGHLQKLFQWAHNAVLITYLILIIKKKLSKVCKSHHLSNYVTFAQVQQLIFSMTTKNLSWQVSQNLYINKMMNLRH